MGQVGEQRPLDDGYVEDGYDESQRAEILEATRDGPSDGMILTDLAPDLGDDDDDDALTMLDSELGEEDDDAELTAGASSEDEVQAGFEDEDEDDELDDADRDALEP